MAKKIDPYNIIRELNFERLAGSKNEVKAAGIIASYIESLGLQVKYDEFSLAAFDTGKGIISTGKQNFEVIPLGLNTSCRVQGELLFLENPEVLKHNKGRYKGKIVLSYRCGRNIEEYIKEQELAALIIIGPPARLAPSRSHRQKTYKDGFINQATVSYDDGIKLSKFHGKEISLEITQKVSNRKARNLIVDIEGYDPDDNLTYLVAHYDSVARSPGASDNAGGTVSLIKIAEYFSKKQPKRNLRLIFFSGEEMGLLGSQHYVAQNETEVSKKGSLVVNIDVSGDPIGMNQVVVTGSKELLGYSDGVLKEGDHCLHHSLDIYSSDQMPFTRLELPGISIARFAGTGSFHIHTPNDNIRNVSRAGLQTPIAAGILLLHRILNAAIYPVNREIDPSLREKIEKYLWNLTYEEPTLKWRPKYKQ